MGENEAGSSPATHFCPLWSIGGTGGWLADPTAGSTNSHVLSLEAECLRPVPV